MKKVGQTWYTDFTFKGKRFRISTGLTNKKDAVEWQKKYLQNMKSESSGKEILQSIKTTLVDKNLTFQEAFESFLNFPRKNKADISHMEYTASVWNDFENFCKDKFKIDQISAVDDSHARAYIAHIRENGRFSPIVYKRGKHTVTNRKTCKKLSSRTANEYVIIPKMVFGVLLQAKHVIENPFEHIELLKLQQAEREIYTPDEVRRIIAATKDTYLYPLMIVGCLTGLRRASICHLKWEQINLENRWIGGKHEKTGAKINIPLSQALYDYLLSIPQTSEYCFPELCRQYDTADYKISEDWKKILNDLGIKNQEVIEGRSRKVSTKDIHSLRHTFASIAIENAPLNVAQGMLGHLSPKMTERYINHATETQKRNCIEQLTLNVLPCSVKDKRAQAVSLLQRATPRQFGKFRDVILRYIHKIYYGLLIMAKTAFIISSAFSACNLLSFAGLVLGIVILVVLFLNSSCLGRTFVVSSFA